MLAAAATAAAAAAAAVGPTGAARMALAAPRLAGAVRVAHTQTEGGGFTVRRPFPSAGVSHLGGTFLMLDHLGPTHYAPGEALGAPNHPHRGFQTVTYLLAGSMQHRDSANGAGQLGPGDVQWMTAGAGVVHSEMPSDEIMARGGTVEGFQLWVNLRRADKWLPPRYQDVRAAAVPVVAVPGAAHGDSRVKVLAGAFAGTRGVVDTVTPVSVLDVQLAPGDALAHPVPDGHVGFVYVFRGALLLGAGAQRAGEGAWAEVLGSSGAFALACPRDAAAPGRALLLHAPPIDEPIARHGPFVMNTHAELQQAFADYREGRMGRIRAS